MNEEETCGQTCPEAQIRYNEQRTKEFLDIRTKFYDRFSPKHECDYSLENLIFMKFDELQTENE